MAVNQNVTTSTGPAPAVSDKHLTCAFHVRFGSKADISTAMSGLPGRTSANSPKQTLAKANLLSVQPIGNAHIVIHNEPGQLFAARRFFPREQRVVALLKEVSSSGRRRKRNGACLPNGLDRRSRVGFGEEKESERVSDNKARFGQETFETRNDTGFDRT